MNETRKSHIATIIKSTTTEQQQQQKKEPKRLAYKYSLYIHSSLHTS